MLSPGRGPLEEYVMGGDWTRFRQERRGVGRQDFVRGGRSDGGAASPARAGGRRAASWLFWAEIDEDGEGKNNDDGAKDDEDERRRGPTEEEGAGGDAGGGLFRRRDNDPALVLPGEALEAVPFRPRGCTSRPRVSYARASGAWSTAATRMRIAWEEERKTTITTMMFRIS